MYCQKCGHHVDPDAKYCDFCGAYQERNDPSVETKKCKKCKREIPVNSNYCPYCGMDQALIIWEEKPRETPAPKETKKEERAMWDDQVEDDNLNDLINNMKKAGIQVKMIKKDDQKEAGPRPGLFRSTGLMLKDAFKTRKRMSLANYWWGYLGMILLSAILFNIVASLHVARNVEELLLVLVMLFYFIPTFTASIRRFHDAGVPTATILLRFVPFIGELIIWIFALRPSVDFTIRPMQKPGQNNRYQNADSNQGSDSSDQQKNDRDQQREDGNNNGNDSRPADSQGHDQQQDGQDDKNEKK